MKTILYIGQLWRGGTCLDRLKSLERIGFNVLPFDVTPYRPRGNRIAASIQWRLARGRWVHDLNRDIIAFSKQCTGPIQFTWIDKGRTIQPQTVADIGRITGRPVIHFTADPAFSVHASAAFTASVAMYHALITTKAFELPAYKSHKAAAIILTRQSYAAERFSPDPGAAHNAVVFIGHYEPHYRRMVDAVPLSYRDVSVWGPGWSGRLRRPRPYVRGGGLWGLDYVHALRSGHIALGLVSKWIPEQSTTRTFEIPACGMLMIAERTNEHQQLFVEDREAVFFDSPAELREKTAYYTANDAARARIAAGGRERCLRSGYDSDSTMRKVVRAVEATL